MNDNDTTRWRGKTVGLTLITLALGVLIGVAVEKREAGAATPVPKAQAASPAASATVADVQSNEPAAPNRQTAETWYPFQEMRNMQAQMDRMFQRSIERFQMNPRTDVFADETGYSSSLDVRDLKNRYEVRAYLPDARASDAQVKLDGNQLTVEVSNAQAEKHQETNEFMSAESWGRYDQMVQLAGNLKADQMKITRKEHELLITIPKANS